MSWETNHYVVGVGEENANLLQDTTKNTRSLSSLFTTLYKNFVGGNGSSSKENVMKG